MLPAGLGVQFLTLPASLRSTINQHTCGTTPTNILFCSTNSHRPFTAKRLVTNASSFPSSSLGADNSTSLQYPNTVRHVTRTVPNDELEGEMLSSASAVTSVIRKFSTSPVDFVQQIGTDQKSKLVLPSHDFQRLCVEQLDLFRRIVDPEAILSVYVRPAGSYVMDRLELRRVMAYPGVNESDIVILIGNFHIPTGLRAAEVALSRLQVEFVPEHKAVVFPMVKLPFVVGFLVAELPMMELEMSCGNVQAEGSDLIHLPSSGKAYTLSSGSCEKSWGIQTKNDESRGIYSFTSEQRSNAMHISHTIAMAHVMDQKSMLLQQSSWQNNVRMSKLVEQIRGPVSSIRTLSKMLVTHMNRSEISSDIVEDILVQGDHIRDTLEELQDAVYLTKANILHYNEGTLKKIHNSTYAHPESSRSQLSYSFPRDTSHEIQNPGLNTVAKDLEMPMPPLALAPLQQRIRPCNVCKVLSDLVEAVRPLAHNQQGNVELSEFSQSLQVAVEEPALRQALSNLIEGALLRTQVGGKVEIVSTRAPAGDALVIIDDDGPDMHHMTQMHSLTPFGPELFSENMLEDNMTWNFVAGLTVAREILENYGCVVRVISPRTTDAALGPGGTRVELWLPSFAAV